MNNTIKIFTSLMMMSACGFASNDIGSGAGTGAGAGAGAGADMSPVTGAGAAAGMGGGVGAMGVMEFKTKDDATQFLKERERAETIELINKKHTKMKSIMQEIENLKEFLKEGDAAFSEVELQEEELDSMNKEARQLDEILSQAKSGADLTFATEFQERKKPLLLRLDRLKTSIQRLKALEKEMDKAFSLLNNLEERLKLLKTDVKALMLCI